MLRERVEDERKQAKLIARMLLDELNHRIKNNMQMYHGLLRSAQRNTSSREAKAVLADAGERVAAMATSRRALSDSNPQSYDINEFLHAVCRGACGRPSARRSRCA